MNGIGRDARRETTPDERRSYEAAFVLLAAAFGIATIWAIVDEVWTRRPWKAYQAEYLERVEDPKPVAISQLVVPGIAVDRCPSCHAGANDRRMEGEDVPAVLRTHPRREELFGAHDVERFGCTVCHRGQGLALTAGKAHGDDDPLWPDPMMRGPYVESSCLGCHPDDVVLRGAPALSLGRTLFRELGCAGCHVTGRDGGEPRRGPALLRVASKLQPGYVLSWIRQPEVRRSAYRMPQFWPGADEDLAMRAKRDEESVAIAAYLLSASKPYPEADAAPHPSFDAAIVDEGKRAFDRSGCRGCHALGGDLDGLEIRDETKVTAEQKEAEDSFFGEEETEEEAPLRPIDHGPPLSGVTSRLRLSFIAPWIVDPTRYSPDTLMPRVEVGQRKAEAIASFLSTVAQVHPPGSPMELEPPIDPALAAKGKRLIQAYGCSGCHLIPGFEDAGPPGPDLSQYGTKDVHELWWGDTPPPAAERTWEASTHAKLKTPRLYATPKVEQVMPAFELTDTEISGLLVYLRSLRSRSLPAAYVRTATVPLVRKGEELIARYNCRGCHTLDERPGDIGRYYVDSHLGPPSLVFEGLRVQPQWLYSFLLNPRALRPWLDISMPRFPFGAAEAESIAAALAQRSKRPILRPVAVAPITKQRAALGERFFTRLQCPQCHLVTREAGAEIAKLAPDLGLARQRLDPEWVKRFLEDPNELLPGTQMPQFFPDGQTPDKDLLGGDVPAQIDLLIEHLMNLGLQPADSFQASATPMPPPKERPR